MPYILVRHKVNDYDAWKSGFDDHSATRKAAGSKGGHLFRTADDPNNLVILMEWDSLDNAQAFASSDDLRETMQRVGVVDRPDIYFLEHLEKVTD